MNGNFKFILTAIWMQLKLADPSETVLYMHHRYMCQISKHQKQLQVLSSTRRQSLAAPAELLPMFQDLSCLAIPLCLLQIQIC